MMKESSVFDASTVINKSSVLLCLPGIMEFVPPKGSLVLPERISSVGFKDIDTLDEGGPKRQRTVTSKQRAGRKLSYPKEVDDKIFQWLLCMRERCLALSTLTKH